MKKKPTMSKKAKETLEKMNFDCKVCEKCGKAMNAAEYWSHPCNLPPHEHSLLMKLGEVCIHKQLKRQCEICEIADERDALKERIRFEGETQGKLLSEIDRLKAELEELRRKAYDIRQAVKDWRDSSISYEKDRDLWKSRYEDQTNALENWW